MLAAHTDILYDAQPIRKLLKVRPESEHLCHRPADLHALFKPQDMRVIAAAPAAQRNPCPQTCGCAHQRPYSKAAPESFFALHTDLLRPMTFWIGAGLEDSGCIDEALSYGGGKYR